MRRFEFVAVDVFTETPFGGNPLAVFPEAEGIAGEEMQRLAAEFNWSEITFVLPPEDPANTARVRIFNPAYEMPFAGHPNVGTALVLDSLGRATGDRMVFEEQAGLVEIGIARPPSGAARARIAAPEPLSVRFELPAAGVAACAGLAAHEVIVGTHAPVLASVGHPFVFAEVSHDSLRRAAPDTSAFRALAEAVPELEGRLSIHLYARLADRIATRMFSPLANIVEDPATGSANAALAALLLSHGDGEDFAADVTQGEEMGRPSFLAVSAHRVADGIRASVEGACVRLMEGTVTLP
ncbi:MAG TPA: PhzF family phenazine biosynthesis protein [Allosphingosinicella sp.]|nr:PhzF family phenazine biosynthesis protein [Allosphingosinicella sp.]